MSNSSPESILSLEELLKVEVPLGKTIDGEFEMTDPEVLRDQKLRAEMTKLREGFEGAMKGEGLRRQIKLKEAMRHARVGLLRAQELGDYGAINTFRQAVLKVYEIKLKRLLERIDEPQGEYETLSNKQILAGQVRGAIHEALEFGILELAQLTVDYLQLKNVLPDQKKVPLDKIKDETVRERLHHLDTLVDQLIRLVQQNLPHIDHVLPQLVKDIIKETNSIYYGPGWDHYIDREHYLEAEKRVALHQVVALLIDEAFRLGFRGNDIFSYLSLDSDLREYPDNLDKSKMMDKKKKKRLGFIRNFLSSTKS